MSLLVVGVLCLLWLVFFLPSYLQSRPTSSPYQSATSFQESLRRLGEPAPDTPSSAPRRQRPARAHSRRRTRKVGGPARHVAARRRDMLTGLSGMVLAAAAVGGYLGGRAMWAPAVPGLAMLGYLVILRIEVARRRRVRRAAPRRSIGPITAPIAADEADIVLSVHRRAAAEPPGDEAFERLAG